MNPAVSHSAPVELLSSPGIFHGWQFVPASPYGRPRILASLSPCGHMLLFGVFVQPTLPWAFGPRDVCTRDHWRSLPLPALRRRLLRSLTNSQLVYVPSCALVLSCSFCPSFVAPVGTRLFCVVRVPPIPLALSLEFVDKDVALEALLKCQKQCENDV